MSRKEKKLIFISIAVALVLILVAYFYQVGTSGVDNQQDTVKENDEVSSKQEDLTVGEPGSTHAHISFLILIEDALYNLSRSKYYEKSEYVHLHEGNGVIIHKHATGVSIPYFLETLGIEFTSDCLILDDGEDYCNQGDKKWRMVVNGKIIEDPSEYELRHGDRILLDYSDDSRTDVRVKAQSTVPNVPKDLMRDVFNVNND